MSEEGQRIEFGDKGPYLFQVLDEEPQGMLLDEHGVLLFQFEELYLPVDLSICAALADGLANMSQADIGPERTGMIPVEFDLTQPTELPLLTGPATESFQHGDTVYMDVRFTDTEARLCLTVRTAAAVGQILSQVPAD